MPDRLGLSEFVTRISRREQVGTGIATRHAQAVLLVLGEALGEEEMKELREQLPGEFEPFFHRQGRKDPRAA